ncbi:LacI family DNA-binding transcriptional regulator [Lacticaseibacillus salsurivasis]|uniref:LacI family DNA-binding transcriptional regulator n=1 Tax=Lacticaseibacillus salsurivasis TaxID=3081441 RepID=UPI0030C7835F
MSEVTNKAKVSLKEIARLAGVSAATVSRVINNNGRFSEETRQRVQNIIKETGYQTNTLAKSLRMNRSNTIGVLVPDLTNEFFSRTVQELEKGLFELGFSTIICDTQRDLAMEEYYLNTLEAKSIDALIVISGEHPFDSASLSDKIPVLCIDREPKNEDTFFISSDHKTGALIATQRIIDRGYTPILVSQQHKSTSRAARIAGFKSALELNNIPISEDHFFALPHNEITPYEASLEKFLKQHTKQRLGLFCLGDYIAALTLRKAIDLGIKVPTDLGIVGFDDNTYARLVTPALTTVRQDIEKIATLSVQTITKLIADPEADIPKKITVPVQLVSRESA